MFNSIQSDEQERGADSFVVGGGTVCHRSDIRSSPLSPLRFLTAPLEGRSILTAFFRFSQIAARSLFEIPVKVVVAYKSRALTGLPRGSTDICGRFGVRIVRRFGRNLSHGHELSSNQ